MIVWVIGLSGAGKSSVSNALYKKWKTISPCTIVVDGDDIRDIFLSNNPSKDYNIEARKKNAHRIVSICKWLDNQGFNVICPILCIFPDILEKNRKIFSNYLEIYLKAPKKTLYERDSKGIYQQYKQGKIENVVGEDIPFPSPQEPDLELLSDGTFSINELSTIILKKILGTKTKHLYNYDKVHHFLTPLDYSFSSHLGDIFFESWHFSRSELKKNLEGRLNKKGELSGKESCLSEELFQTLLKKINEKNIEIFKNQNSILNLLVKKFEVTKKVYQYYPKDIDLFMKKNRSNYCCISSYILFAQVLDEAFKFSNCLTYLNSLSKVLDIIGSYQCFIKDSEIPTVVNLIKSEQSYNNLIQKA